MDVKEGRSTGLKRRALLSSPSSYGRRSLGSSEGPVSARPAVCVEFLPQPALQPYCQSVSPGVPPSENYEGLTSKTQRHPVRS